MNFSRHKTVGNSKSVSLSYVAANDGSKRRVGEGSPTCHTDGKVPTHTVVKITAKRGKRGRKPSPMSGLFRLFHHRRHHCPNSSQTRDASEEPAPVMVDYPTGSSASPSKPYQAPCAGRRDLCLRTSARQPRRTKRNSRSCSHVDGDRRRPGEERIGEGRGREWILELGGYDALERGT